MSLKKTIASLARERLTGLLLNVYFNSKYDIIEGKKILKVLGEDL